MPVEKELDAFLAAVREGVTRWMESALKPAESKQESPKESVWAKANREAQDAAEESSAPITGETFEDDFSARLKEQATKIVNDYGIRERWTLQTETWARETIEAKVYSDSEVAKTCYTAASFLDRSELDLNFSSVWSALPRAVRLRLRDYIIQDWVARCEKVSGRQVLRNFGAAMHVEDEEPNDDRDLYL
jgi:hypothetical protein